MTIKIKDADGNIQYVDGAGTGSEADPLVPFHKEKRAGPVNDIFAMDMDDVGDETGSIDMAVDGSTVPKEFLTTPAADKVYRITRAIIYVQDSGSFDATKWGNNLTLPNGFDFEVTRDGVTSPIFKESIKTTGDVAALTFDTEVRSWGTGDEYMVARWTFTKMGAPIRLVGATGDHMTFRVNDNITGLTRQTIVLQGYIE